ncbi:MAG TPA: hypothetical protein VF927_06935 [Solirubrobacteraceae bacterium]
MDLKRFSATLNARLLDFAWDEWAQMGVSGVPRRRSSWAEDPEALIIFTLQVARSDPRLFDELLDWMLLNERRLSIRRLRAVCVDDADRALLAATIGWLARRAPRARLKGTSKRGSADSLEPLFAGSVTLGEPDPDFKAAGLLRSYSEPSGKSGPPDLSLPINLAFRLRDILGVGIRSEVVRILLGTHTDRVTTAALARSSVYAKRNVHDALSDLAAADVLSAVTISGEQRYSIDKPRWAALLGLEPRDLPVHYEWPALLGVLRTILRWCEDPDLLDASAYLLASSARMLLERLRPELAFAGVPTNLRARAEDALPALEAVIEDILTPLEGASASGR